MKFLFWLGIVSALVSAGVLALFFAHERAERARILKNYGSEYLKLVKSHRLNS